MHLAIEQLEVRYPHRPLPALDGVSLGLKAGQIGVLLGPSGCGKTTLLRAIAGLERAHQGEIRLAGQTISNARTHLAPEQRRMGMVFQDHALFPHLSVQDNVMFGLLDQPRAQRQARAQAMLTLVGLSNSAHRHPHELSGGQQQRVAVARALVIEPAVLLFDEPLSNLDARLRRSMREEIRGLQQRLGLTVAYVTHDQSEALAVSDQIIVMDGGRIAQAGTPQGLYERPASAFVAGFMGEAMLFDGQSLADGSISIGPLRFVPRHPVAAGAIKAAIRPEAWRIVSSTDAALSGPLLKQAYLGSFQELTIDTPLGPVFVVSPQVDRQWVLGEKLGLALGERGVTVVAA